MYKIIERRAGDFIDLESYFNSMLDNAELIEKFFILLIGRIPNEDEVEGIIFQFAKEVSEIKEGFEFIYNPPQPPSSTDISNPTIGDGYRQEFAEMYGGYTSIILLICKTFPLEPDQVLQKPLSWFLYWGNCLLHRQFVENIK